MNWKDFARFEFELLPIERQQQISDMLWAMERTKRAYKKLIEKTDELVKSQFIEMFEGKERFPIWLIKDLAKVKVGIVIQPTQYYSTGQEGVKVFRSANVRPFYIDDKEWAYFTLESHEKMSKTHVHTNDVLIVRSGVNLGQSCIVGEAYDDYNAIDVLITTPDIKIVLPEYLCGFVNYPIGKKQIVEGQQGVAQKHLNVHIFENAKIPIPPMQLQQKFCELLHQTDKSKFAAKQALADLTAAQKALMRQYLG